MKARRQALQPEEKEMRDWATLRVVDPEDRGHGGLRCRVFHKHVRGGTVEAPVLMPRPADWPGAGDDPGFDVRWGIRAMPREPCAFQNRQWVVLLKLLAGSAHAAFLASREAPPDSTWAAVQRALPLPRDLASLVATFLPADVAVRAALCEVKGHAPRSEFAVKLVPWLTPRQSAAVRSHPETRQTVWMRAEGTKPGEQHWWYRSYRLCVHAPPAADGQPPRPLLLTVGALQRVLNRVGDLDPAAVLGRVRVAVVAPFKDAGLPCLSSRLCGFFQAGGGAARPGPHHELMRVHVRSRAALSHNAGKAAIRSEAPALWWFPLSTRMLWSALHVEGVPQRPAAPPLMGGTLMMVNACQGPFARGAELPTDCVVAAMGTAPWLTPADVERARGGRTASALMAARDRDFLTVACPNLFEGCDCRRFYGNERLKMSDGSWVVRDLLKP